MDKITIELSRNEISAVIAFLERSQVLGKEACGFVSILTKLMTALNEQTDKTE